MTFKMGDIPSLVPGNHATTRRILQLMVKSGTLRATGGGVPGSHYTLEKDEALLAIVASALHGLGLNWASIGEAIMSIRNLNRRQQGAVFDIPLQGSSPLITFLVLNVAARTDNGAPIFHVEHQLGDNSHMNSTELGSIVINLNDLFVLIKEKLDQES